MPRAGGLDDQLAGDILRMEQALSVYHAFRAREDAPNAVQFAKSHPDIADYCWEIEQMDYEDA